LALLLAALGASLVGAADPPAKAEDKQEAAVRKAAEKAEVHGVGVYGPEHSRLGHVKDWPLLAEILRTKRGPAGRVWELLSDESRKRLSDDALVLNLRAEDRGQNPIRGSVAAELRKIQDNPDFYTAAAFKDVPLTKDLKDLIALGKKRTAYQTALLNYALLDKALPGCIPELPDNFRTIKVDVLAGSDVVLVLSSYERCRWKVSLREGARVTGVVLCGYHAVEVVGVDAPTVYRAYYEPDGVTVFRGGTKYLFGHDEKQEEFKELLAGVKEITGKEFTKFQGEARPGPFSEPYTIRPKGDK
jgi:hypothetical protein